MEVSSLISLRSIDVQHNFMSSDLDSVSSISSSQGSAMGPPVAPSAVGLLDQRYAEQRRNQLDIINKLQSLGATLDFDIPQIVVIGSQSAGKSSLIESISGITLPRASGTCTRCPTECRLVQSSEEWVCKVAIRILTDQYGQPMERVEEIPFGPPIHDPLKVEDRIKRAQWAALNPGVNPLQFRKADDHPNMGRNAMDFTTNCVSLEVRGPNLTDLSFCDLPGLIASVSDDGNVDDIEKVKTLVSTYITKPSCLILLTIACETDFETQGAYSLARQHDMDGSRTIGVLTKPDRIETLDETGKWIKLIKNERSALQHGWFCVKQPNADDLKKQLSFQEARQLGEEFFQVTPPWASLEGRYKRQLGTRNLTQSLNKHLLNLISKRFPELMDELVARLAETNAALQALPVPPSENPELELIHLVGEFTDDVFRNAEGFTYDSLGKTNNHFEKLREVYDQFREKIQQTAPKFKPFYRREVTLASKTEPLVDNLNEDAVHLDDVVREVHKATTRELPGHTPSVVVKKLIADSTSKWETPAHALIETVYRIVLKHNCELVEKHFGRFTSGGLRQTILRIVQEFTRQNREEAKKRVEWLLELESDPFTLNHHYLDDYKQKYLQVFKDEREAVVPDSSAPSGWESGRDAFEAMATVRAYFQVAYKRVVDNLPLAIDRELVRLKKRSFQEAITLGLQLTGSGVAERCTRLLAEPVDVTERRNELRNKLHRLTEAQGELFGATP